MKVKDSPQKQENLMSFGVNITEYTAPVLGYLDLHLSALSKEGFAMPPALM